MRHSTHAAGVALAALAGIPALAQDTPDGPVVVSPRPELRPFFLYGFEAAIELEWRRNVDTLTPDGEGRQRDVEDRLREIFELRTGGYVGHPNLLELDLGGRVWLEQTHLKFDSSGTNTRTSQLLGEWDVSGLFIKESKLPFTLYTRQNISDIDQQFGGTLENRFRETGARFNLRDQTMPTNIQIFRRTIEQRNAQNAQDFNIDQDTIQADGQIEINQNQRIAWDAKYDDIDESGNLRQPLSFHRVEANGLHTLEFGEGDRNVLRTQARYYNEEGDRFLRQVRIEPRLRLEHSENLQSWYDYTFGKDDRRDQDQMTNRFTANFQHQLFDSLKTIGNAGINRLDIPTEDFDSTEYFGRIDIEYLKAVPGGSLSARLDVGMSRNVQSDLGAPIQITDEVQTFDAANMIILTGRTIDENSIVITDVPGIIVYTEGVDYALTSFPDSVQIQRLAGGSIASGQTVLVDYVIGPQPGGTTDTLGLGGELRYTFEEGFLTGLSVYGGIFNQDERREIVTATFGENDFTDVRYGVEYNRANLYFRAEGQHRTSTVSPFDAFRVEGRYRQPLGAGSNLVLGALFQDINRTAEDSRNATTTFSGQWNQRIGQDLRFALLLQYQMTNDNRAPDAEAFEQQFDITWTYRQTEVYAQVRTSINDTRADDTSFQRFVVGVRREF